MPTWGPSVPASVAPSAAAALAATAAANATAAALAAAALASSAPSEWADVTKAVNAIPATSSEWGAPTEGSTTATLGWGDEVPEGVSVDRPQTPGVTVVVKPISKIIAPGAKMSWAQVTK